VNNFDFVVLYSVYYLIVQRPDFLTNFFACDCTVVAVVLQRTASIPSSLVSDLMHQQHCH